MADRRNRKKGEYIGAGQAAHAQAAIRKAIEEFSMAIRSGGNGYRRSVSANREGGKLPAPFPLPFIDSDAILPCAYVGAGV
jgi:hypothetical protein